MKYQYVKHIALGLALLLTAGLSGCGKDFGSLSDTAESGISDTVSDAGDENAPHNESAEGDAESTDDENSAADSDASQNADTPVSDGADTPDANNPDASSGNSENSTPDVPEQSSQADAGDDSAYKIGSAPTVGIGKVIAKPGQKEVAVDLQLWNNPGYTSCGIQIIHDPALQPRLQDEKMVYIESGEAAEGLMTACITAGDAPVLAFGTVGLENNDKSGKLCTMYFTLPDNAAAGTVYLFAVTIDSMIDEQSQSIGAESIDGEIRIE